MKKKALITGVGGDIGQSIIKCLKDTNYNLYLFGCDIDLFAAGKNQVNKFYRAPKAVESGKYLIFLKKLINKEDISYIFPSTEVEIEFFDKYRNYFDARKVELFINNSFIIKTFLDKFNTAIFLKNHNLSSPRTYLLRDYTGVLPFPLLLKPRKGSGGKKNIIITDIEELAYWNNKVNDAIVQEIIGSIDDEYTVAVFSDRKEIRSIAFKRYLGYEGLTKVAHLVHDNKIEGIAKKVAKAVNLEGSLNMQMRKTKKGYFIFEINPRLSSTVYIRHCFGFQDTKWWLDLKEGRKIKYVPKFKEGTAVRTISETFFDLHSW